MPRQTFLARIIREPWPSIPQPRRGPTAPAVPWRQLQPEPESRDALERAPEPRRAVPWSPLDPAQEGRPPARTDRRRRERPPGAHSPVPDAPLRSAVPPRIGPETHPAPGVPDRIVLAAALARRRKAPPRSPPAVRRSGAVAALRHPTTA